MADVGVGSFLSGVALATVGFILNEVISFQIKAYRLRKIIVVDAESTVAGLVENLASFGEIESSLNDGKAASFIWEGAGGPPSFLGDIPVYLTTRESALALRYYAAEDRIDAIRSEFNDAVRGVLTEKDKKDAYTAIAISCLHDLKRNYEEARESGNALAALVKKNFWGEDEPE
jgi:hypothetical protein